MGQNHFAYHRRERIRVLIIIGIAGSEGKAG
jgi:hypothetical protein